MTDKQIIIDGVDVSECEYYNKDDKTCREVNGKYETDICDFDKCENSNCYFKQLKRKEQECEELKKQLMQKSEVDMFFNTPLEGWSNDPCEICPHKAENEALKKQCNSLQQEVKQWKHEYEMLYAAIELLQKSRENVKEYMSKISINERDN